MKIVQLTAQNIKRLKAVCIRPQGAVVPITGKNAQGKSSVLDAITMALGGKDAQPPKPVRNGAKSASVVLDLGDKIVTRTFTGETQTLTVTAKDGAKYTSPQKVLDSLVGELTFDPLAFSRMSSKEQLATLKRVANLNFDAIDAERAKLFDQRTDLNRQVKHMEGQLAFMPEIEAPDEEVSLQALFAQQQDMNAVKAKNDECRRELEQAEATLSSFRGELARFEQSRQPVWDRNQREIDRLKAQLEGMIQRQKDEDAEIAGDIERCKSKVNDQQKVVAGFREGVAALQDPDPSVIQQQLTDAEENNRKVRARKARNQAVTALDDAKSKADGLTVAIRNIDDAKEKALADAKLPVPGLGFSEHGVTVNGLPFEQASSAEQLRVSVAMGIALNPKLRVLLIRDGSLLDDDSLEILAKMAQEHDVQVWLERVSNGEPVGVVIEDGTASGPETVQPSQ